MNYQYHFFSERVYKISLLILSLFLIVSLFIGVSYAYWRFSSHQKNTNVASTNCFALSFNDNTEAIFLTDMLPTNDEEGLKEKGYSFTIKNTCDAISTYEVNLEDILVSSEVKQFPNKYIKVSLNNSTPKILNTYEEVKPTIEEATNSFKLTSGSLKSGEEATYELKLWMDEDTPALDEVMYATFESKITVNASFVEEKDLLNEITIFATSQNEMYSNVKETFKIEATSKEKDIIEYSYDKSVWTSITPSKTLSLEKDFFKEGSYPFYVKDEVGNIKEYRIETDKLDQVAPEREIKEENNHETYLLKITMTDTKSGMSSYQITESKETPTEWLDYKGEIEKEIDKNGTYYIWSQDKAGNISYEAYSVHLIDKEAPTIVLKNTLTDWGVKDTINIHLTDDVIGLSGYQVTMSEEEPTSFITIENTLDTTIPYDVTQNGTYYVYAKDAYNHVSHEKIIIDKMDDVAPFITGITNSSDNNWTKEDVTITITALDNEMGVEKYQIRYNGSDNNWQDLESNTFTFQKEMNETVYCRTIDKAGNISEEKSTVIKIDRTNPDAPSITNFKENTWISDDLPITLTSSDAGSGIDHFEWYENGSWTTRDLTTNENAGTITYTDERNETIRFRVIDKVGNISAESTTVIKIDKTKPTQSLSVSSSTSGNNGWYKALSFKVNTQDNQSSVESSKYCVTTGSSCVPSTIASLNNNTYTVDLGTDASAQKVCVNTTDVAGNTSDTTCSNTYYVDKTSPVATLKASVSGTNIVINASSSTDQGSGIVTYYYSKDGGSTFVSSTSSSYTFTGFTLGNTYKMALKVVDKTGNVSSVTTSDVFVSGLATSIIKTLVTGASTSSSTVYTSSSKTSSTCTYTFAYDNTSDNNLRYVGKNPCNYIKVDNEYWRIVGIMNNIDNGLGTKESRLKLMRDESIGSYSWDTSASSVNSGYGVNEWSQADIMKLLNPGYEGTSVGGSLYYNNKSGNCYVNSNNTTSSCNFTSTGLKAILKSLIGNAKWHTGSNGSNDYTSASNGLARHFYGYERSNSTGKLCSSGQHCNDTVTRTTSWVGKVGLIYPSDYGYATSGGSSVNRSSCLNKELNSWKNVRDCYTNDWLYKSGYWQWTLSPGVYTNVARNVFYIHNNANVFYDRAYYAGAIHPTVYLITSAKIINGEGSKEKPYQLG